MSDQVELQIELQDLAVELEKALALAREGRYAELQRQAAELDRSCRAAASRAPRSAVDSQIAAAVGAVRQRSFVLSEVLGHVAQVQGCLLEIGHGGSRQYSHSGAQARAEADLGGGERLSAEA